MKRTRILLLCILLAVSFPAAAQDAACTIDLAPIAASIVQAQAAASGGDTAQALALMAQIRAKLEATEALCGSGAGGPVAPPEELVTLRHQYESAVGTVQFLFPEGWSLNRDSGGVMVASAPDILQRDFNTDPPPMFPGEALIFVTAGDIDSFGGDEGDDLLTLMRYLADDVPADFGRISEPTRATVNDREAAIFTVLGANAEIMFMTLEIGTSGDETAYGQFILLTSPGELNAYESTLQAVATSMELVP